MAKYNYHPKTKEELNILISELVSERGYNANLNDIDTSSITDLSWMFHNCEFDLDISNWDVSNVVTMESTFLGCCGMHCDISDWDVGNVKNMQLTFYGCHNLKCNLSNWNISEDCNCHEMLLDKGDSIGYFEDSNESPSEKWKTTVVSLSIMAVILFIFLLSKYC